MTYYMKSSTQKMMDAVNDVKKMPGYVDKPYRGWKERARAKAKVKKGIEVAAEAYGGMDEEAILRAVGIIQDGTLT